MVDKIELGAHMHYAFALLFLLCSGLPCLAAAGLSCESTPAVEAAQRELNRKREGATFEQVLVLQQKAYDQLHQLDPQDYRPARRHMFDVRYDTPEQWDALRDSILSDARSHPQDALKLVLAALALSRKDTPQAMRLLEQSIAAKPDYAPAYLELSGYYAGSGKYIDKTKAATYLQKFYQLCPSSRDGFAMYGLKKSESSELKAQVARNLRQRLSASTDPFVLRSYSDVWSLEFSTLPVTEHSKERQRVADDLSRLEKLPIQPTAEWLSFLRDGYKQSGAPESQIKAIEARILTEFPHSDEAFGISYHSWRDQYPEPVGEASAADWQQYMRLALAHYREVMQRFPQKHGFGEYIPVEYTSRRDGASNEEIVREGEAYIEQYDLYRGPSSGYREYIAGIFLDHNLQPARTLELLQEARRLRDSPRQRNDFEPADYYKPKEIEDHSQTHWAYEASFRVLYLRACRSAKDKAAAEALTTQVETAPPTYSKALPAYWNARAILAEIEGRTPDALAYYQKALLLREPPKKQYGVLNDTLLADARRVWTSSRGSEEAFAIWSQPDISKKPDLAEGRWEKPDKELPAFELADLQGKMWKLKSLEGQKVLINIWATWCGPCQAELPHLEKLYQQTKNRSDIKIISLNFDEDVGMVEPFVKKKGFAFPVVPAYSFLVNKIDVNSIPRNWIVNANGGWRWEQIGFDSSEPDWENSVLSRLEGTK